MNSNIFWSLIMLLCFNKGMLVSQTAPESSEFRELDENSIINLYDAFGDEIDGLQWDFGFSCIINYKGRIILFDSGTNADIFRKNVETLNIDLRSVDFVIASHAHFDHINGFDHLLKINPDVKIYFPFDPFWGSSFPFNISGQEPAVVDSLDDRMKYFSGNHERFIFEQSGRFWNANIQFVREHIEIEPGVKLVATKSPYMGYFSKYPDLEKKDNSISAMSDADNTSFIPLMEISLSLATDDGEVIVVGCSHSTVERIIIETRKYTGNDISLVYGGYHLLPYKRDVLEGLANRMMNEYGVKSVAPAHCTGHLAFRVFKKVFGHNYLFAGLGEKLKF